MPKFFFQNPAVSRNLTPEQRLNDNNETSHGASGKSPAINDQYNLRKSLPSEIQTAITEWATSLQHMPWKLKRRAIGRFSGSFADNFLAIVPTLTDEEYDSLSLLGITCLLEELEDGEVIEDEDQAKCYLESIHEHHQEMAKTYLEGIAASKSILH
ncbi:MAG: hypothetical protein CMM58_05955 [Rhodospirillaceae bacterium]|nr:hypothetical protein [Rhodospirillaceae bacterium]|tara:strand:+ start:1229 stop:1696 length:468 start_codon:yes stop_codon:yes gene_type:complete